MVITKCKNITDLKNLASPLKPDYLNSEQNIPNIDKSQFVMAYYYKAICLEFTNYKNEALKN